MTLLASVQRACDRLGLSRPSAVYAGTDQTARTMLALAILEARELSERHNWTALLREKTFTSTATETQADAIPTDFARFVNETFWNRTQRRPVHGPLTESEWQLIKANGSVVLPDRFRMRGSSMLITPTPTAGWTYAYEYVSTDRWGTGKPDPTDDTDSLALDESLLVDGLVWRYLQSKGFDYAEAQATYQRRVADAIHRDGGRRRLNFGQERMMRPGVSVPEGSWSL